MNRLRDIAPNKWSWAIIGLVVVMLLLLIGVMSFIAQRNKTAAGPRLLNEPTKAREARPFTAKPDPRFAPLPLEPEKHGK